MSGVHAKVGAVAIEPEAQRSALVPTPTLPDNRLQLPAAACAACGEDVDTLRTPSLLAFEDGVRFLCGEPCKRDYRAGARARRKPQLTGTPASGVKPVAIAAAPPRPSLLPSARASWLSAGIAAVLLSGGLACFDELPELALSSALATGLAGTVALRLSTASFGVLGPFAWLCGPLGVAGAAIAGYLTSLRTGSNLAQLGAACAALAVLLRAYFDARAEQPIARAAEQLRALLRPSPGPLDGESSPERARIGEELVVRRGERVPVDGVVQFGEARVLPFPGSSLPIARRPGDTLLAGASVVEGGVRVLATRIGEDRSLARALRAGEVHPREGAKLIRWCSELCRWGGLFSLIVAAGVWVWLDPAARVWPLSAASALLIASPWLALRRAADWPLTAAACAAAARGVVFQSGAALERAGAVDMVALTPHRTLTEGEPDLVELHMLGNDVPEELLSLAAGAELAAGNSAAGRAIAGYAQVRGIAPAEVRRSVAVAGHGVTALGPGGEEVVVGSRRLLLDHGVSVALAESQAARAESLGRMAVFVSVAGRVRAVLALDDPLRGGARAAVQRMFDLGLELVLLTGGQRGPVEHLAARLEIAHIKAELLPEERGQEVRSLREAGNKLAVIGFPADDNPALSAADVGVALGAAGGPAGDRAIALVGDDVRDAAAALWIARAARDAGLNAVRVAGSTFALACVAAALGVLEPVFAALLALAVDAHCIHTGARLLRRIALRLPAGS